VDDPASWAQAIAALAPASPLYTRKVAEGRDRAGWFTWARAGASLLEAIFALSDRALEKAA
jgi:glycosyltransferase involved in cell wall biosynthesis